MDYFSKKLTAKEMKVREEHVPKEVRGQGNILFACEMKDWGVFIYLKEAASGWKGVGKYLMEHGLGMIHGGFTLTSKTSRNKQA